MPITIPTPTARDSIYTYRTQAGCGTVVVRVILTLPTPRVMTYAEVSDGTIEPVSMFIDDLLMYVDDAVTRNQETLGLTGVLPVGH
jgi:hypothetical protein